MKAGLDRPDRGRPPPGEARRPTSAARSCSTSPPGEECAEPGTLSLLQAGFTGDFGIVTEPTELRVATAERGLAYYTHPHQGPVDPREQGAPRAQPERGASRPCSTRSRRTTQEIRRATHPLLPGRLVHPDRDPRRRQGERGSPTTATLLLDRRLLPGETVDGELEAMRRRLDPHPARRSRLRLRDLRSSSTRSSRPRSPRLALRRTGRGGRRGGHGPCATEIYGTPYASDVRNLVNDAGIEAVTFGPGNVAECHCANERVSIQQLREAALATAHVARELLF